MNREGFSWKLLLVALVLVMLGMLLMFQSSNMLFEINPLSIVFIVLASFLIFSGIALMIMAIVAIDSI